jgi:hypothetical protein
MPISENKGNPFDPGRMIDFEIKHCHDEDRKSILVVMKQLANSLECTDHTVGLHSGDIKLFMELVQALALRLARIEAQLGITEPVVVPGD